MDPEPENKAARRPGAGTQPWATVRRGCVGRQAPAPEEDEMNRIAEMVEIVREEVTAPGINQSRGRWNEKGDCCMGSRIAHALGIESGLYLEGVDEWAARMGITRAHVAVMLQDAGAGHDPLGSGRWPECPSIVWRRLAAVERAPALTGRDLGRLNLAYVNLREENLHRTDLSGCNLREADLSNSDLSFARLEGAMLHRANLRCANLSGAVLDWSNLSWADLTKANLRGATSRGVDLSSARVAGTRLERTRERNPALDRLPVARDANHTKLDERSRS